MNNTMNPALKKHSDTAPGADLFQAGIMTQMRQKVMQAARGEGGACPCCDQYVKVYKRSISSTMARQLIRVYRLHGEGTWFHVRDAMAEGDTGVSDFAKLERWGLIEKRPHEPGDGGKRTSGYWRITPDGEKFVTGRGQVDEFALVYNNNHLGFEGGLITIFSCLGNKFDYKTLMGLPG